ncbi:RNA polymerase sigma-70 factor (ECF subfamily) [Palleronia aestuarii]|uniref:RNA polymerase sigma-70 factor (ECF subfamily) n=1 Tax=Palleronia aestuarii TaxID=568105 RepID=A0A2W7NHW1_9RHOB|nr:sigma-70 family RNA polymerase sigma factor [Palleronia aestuarii]PZX16244.1 RNA polymerase sigma-70 factor (ECF subfamily) [Palleronia aestuarii]
MATTPDDIERLIHRVSLGDRGAFLALYDATSAKLFGICLRVLKNRADAEEALQESFVKVWRNAGRYAANGLSPMTWLITIARNTAIDRLRSRRSDTASGDVPWDLPDQGAGPEDVAIASSEARRINDCLEELDKDRAQAVRGAYLDGLSYKELAERHGVPLNTMRTWLRRSLQALRECLDR